MVPIFNISSPGASATAWLTRLLNQHPRVVCLHALREDPFHGEPIEPAEMIKGLYYLHGITKDQRCFGVNHSYYDPGIYDDLTAVGGGYMAILRHPVSRIQSLFQHHYRDVERHPVSNGDVFGTIRDNDTTARYLPLFEQRVIDTLYADMANLIRVKSEEVALFERLTADAGYCRARLETLLDDELAWFEPTIAASFDDKFNQHAAVAQAVDEIYAQWPASYRACFREHIERFGVAAVSDIYGHFGYDVARMLAA